MKRIQLPILVVGLSLTPVSVHATPYYVNNCGHDTNCNGLYPACWSSGVSNCAKKTIKAGMDLGQTSVDVVNVAPGIYTGDDNRNLEFPRTAGVARAFTVKCASYPENCVIDCQGGNPCQSSSPGRRGFLFDNDGAFNDSVVDGFTIRNGCMQTNPYIGGGILIDHSSPTIRNCILENNTATNGGGIALRGENEILEFAPVIENCTIKNNHSEGGSGGGIYATAHIDPFVKNCLISGNSATNVGGGLYHDLGCDPQIEGCVIENNSAVFGGGGVYVMSLKEHPNIARPRILRSRIGPNNRTTHSTGNGGGIWVDGIWGGNTVDVQLWIQNCSIIENHADASNGGGVAFTDGVLGFEMNINMVNDVIAGNTALSGGAAYVNQHTPLTMANVTMMHNKALGTSGGSAIFFEGQSPSTVSNAVLWHDVNPPAQAQVRVGQSFSWDKLTVQRSDVQDTLPEHVLFNNNIASNPQFSDLDGYDNDAATILDNDYHLVSGSPCNDRGSVPLVPSDDLDLDGNPATTVHVTVDREDRDRYEDDPNAPNNDGVDESPYFDVDIGAYEFGGCPTGTITSASPVDGRRDARQPHPPLDNLLPNRQGIGSPNDYAGGPEPIDITVQNGGVALRGAGIVECWDLCETGIEQVEGIPALNPNRIVTVAELPFDFYQALGVYRIFLERPISAGHWTTIEYLGGSSYVSYASLPGDANQDGFTLSQDLGLLNAILNGGCQPSYSPYQWDMNHNGLCEPGTSGLTDLNRAIDLFNGTDKFIPWSAKQLPANSCAGGGFAMAGSSGGISVGDDFVEFLTMLEAPQGATEKELESFIGTVLDLIRSELSKAERGELVKVLGNPGLVFASDEVRAFVPSVIEALTE